MRVRDSLAVWLTMLAFVPTVMAKDETPAQKDQPQAETPQQTDQPRADQKQTNETKASDQATHADHQMQQMMAACLALSNHAEIELAKVAMDKTQNAEVKKLAQQILEDHTAAAQQLMQFMPKVNLAVERNTETTATDQKQSANQHHDAMQQMMQKIAKNELAMTKDVLVRYEGQDFDMGYLGQQIIAHTQLLAKLYVMEKEGSPQFQTVVKDMIAKADEHFKEASQLSRQLEGRDDRQASSTASTTNKNNTRRALSAEPESQATPAKAPKEKNLEKAGNRQNE